MLAKAMGENLVGLERQSGKPYPKVAQELAVYKLMQLVSEKEFSLRETAWQAIKAEKDMDILTMLILLVGLPSKDLNFYRYRKFILESPELWPDMRATYLKTIEIEKARPNAKKKISPGKNKNKNKNKKKNKRKG